MIRSLAPLTLLVLFCSSATLAADQPVSFESLDKNSDGKISLNEAAENDAVFVAFKNLDANKDGDLTREEFERYKGGKTAA